MAGRPLMIVTDANKYSIGAALLQQQDKDDTKAWSTVGYKSKTLDGTQRNYSTT